MVTKSPSGALSPYYYKGGYFHGIHYGSYFHDKEALFAMMDKEEAFILKSSEKRRILIDLYETDLSQDVTDKIAAHIFRLSPKIVKLAITSDKKNLRLLRTRLKKGLPPGCVQLYFCTDMEDAKTWLVTE